MKPWRSTLSLIGLVLILALLAGSCVPWNPFSGAGFGDLKIYWVSYNRLYSAYLDGTYVEELYYDPGAPDYAGIAIDPLNWKVYWSATMSINLFRADLDGAEKETVSSMVAATALAVDPYDDKIYYATSGGMEIKRMNLDGSGIETLYNLGNWITDIALDLVNERIYWCDNSFIYSSTLTAPLSPQAVLSRADSVERIALDVSGDMIYFSEGTPPNLYKAPLSGGPASFVYSAMNSVGALDVDPFEGRLYWTKPSASTGIYIDSVGVDGSDFRSVISIPGSGDALRLALQLWP